VQKLQQQLTDTQTVAQVCRCFSVLSAEDCVISSNGVLVIVFESLLSLSLSLSLYLSVSLSLSLSLSLSISLSLSPSLSLFLSFSLSLSLSLSFLDVLFYSATRRNSETPSSHFRRNFRCDSNFFMFVASLFSFQTIFLKTIGPRESLRVKCVGTGRTSRRRTQIARSTPLFNFLIFFLPCPRLELFNCSRFRPR